MDKSVNGSNGQAEQANLFADFPVPTYDEWRTAAEETLKGAPFEKRLISRTYEGIKLQPIYRPEDTADLPAQHTLPGFAPYLRGTSPTGYLVAGWGVAQDIAAPTPEAFNTAIRHDLERGQTVVNLGSVPLYSLSDLDTALANLDLAAQPLLLNIPTAPLPSAAALLALAQQRGITPDALRGQVAHDPLHRLASTGSIPSSLDASYDRIAALLAWCRDNAPHLRCVTVQTHAYHNSGATAVQELAIALATTVACTNALLKRGHDINTIAAHTTMEMSVGTQVFMEIAKLRAARLLWQQVIAAYGGDAQAQQLHMHVRSANWNKTIYDPYVNMLRTTVEAFAGAIGGIDAMHVAPFDTVIRPPDEFARRIARNTQTILQTESHLTHIIDPAGGSWYVEKLTDEVGRAAWALFQQIEQQGGIVATLQAGWLQDQIAQVAAERRANLATRKDVLVGTNMYPNLREERLATPATPPATPPPPALTPNNAALGAIREQIASDPTAPALVDAAIAAATAGATFTEIAAALHITATPTTIDPLPVGRLAEPFEQLRDAAEAYAAQHGHHPQVFLAGMGPLARHKPRSDFSAGFFEVGGFAPIRPDGFDTPEAAAAAARESGAAIVVICGTDDDYPQVVPPLAQQLKADNPQVKVILAGLPQEHIEAFKAAGVDEFIHIRANCYELLANLQQEIGVSA